MGKGYFKTEDGQVFTVPEEQVNSTLDSGFEPASEAEADAYDRDIAGGIEAAPPKVTPELSELEGIAGQMLRQEPAKTERYVPTGLEGLAAGTMAALENFGDALAFNIPGAVASAVDPEYARRAQLRKEQFPISAGAGTAAGVIVPTAGTLLKGTKYAARIPFLQEAADLDFASRALGAVGTRITTGKELKRVKDFFEPIARSNLENELAAAGRVGEEVSEAALNAEIARLTEERVVAGLLGVDAKPGVINSTSRFVKNMLTTGGGQAAAGAVYGSISGGFQGIKNARVAGEDLAPAFWEGAKEGGETGAIIGTTLGLGVPLAFKGLAKTLDYSNTAIRKAAEFILPTVSGKVTGASKEEIKAGYEALRRARDSGQLDDVLNDMGGALDRQYSETLRIIGDFKMPSDILDPTLTPKETALYQRRYDATVFPKFEEMVEAAGAMKQKWMTKNKEGAYKFNTRKLKEYFNQFVERSPTTDKKEVVVPFALPREIGEFMSASRNYLEAANELNQLTQRVAGKDPSEFNKLLELSDDVLAARPRQIVFGEAGDLSGKSRNAIDYLSDIQRLKEFEAATQNIAEAAPPGTIAKAAPSIPIAGGAQTLLNIGDYTIGTAAGELGVLGGIGAGVKAVFDPAATLRTLETINNKVNKTNTRLDQFAAFQLGKTKAISPVRGAVRAGTKFLEPEEGYEPSYNRFLAESKKIEKLKDPANLAKVYDETYFGLDDFSDEASASVKKAISDGVNFLDTKIPRKPSGWSLGAWKPSKNEINKFLRYTKYVYNPDTFYEDVEKLGYVPDEGLEVFQQIYPERFKGLKYRLLTDLAEQQEAGKPVPQKLRASLNKIIGLQTEGLTPEQIKKNQDAMLPPEAKAPQRKPKDATREALPSNPIGP